MTIPATGTERATEREAAIAAVAAASRICRRVRAAFDPSEATSKADDSPVTVADLASQAVISMALAESMPGDGVMGEEDTLPLTESPALAEVVLARVREERPAATLDDVVAALDRCDDPGGPGRRWWTLDPVDGTKGFLRGGQYAVALALIEDGEVVLAVMGSPNLPLDGGTELDVAGTGTLLGAERGRGAWQAPLDAPGDAAARRPIMTADITAARDARYAESLEAGHSSQPVAARIGEALGITAPPLRLDSQTKYALVARGEASIYLRLPHGDYRENVWDHASGVLIVTEAGGRVSDVEGRPLDLTAGTRMTRNRGVVATAAGIHDEVLAGVGSVLRS